MIHVQLLGGPIGIRYRTYNTKQPAPSALLVRAQKTERTYCVYELASHSERNVYHYTFVGAYSSFDVARERKRLITARHAYAKDRAIENQNQGESTMSLDPTKLYAAVKFRDSAVSGHAGKIYAIELNNAVFTNGTPKAGSFLIAHAGGRYALVEVIELNDDTDVDDYQLCKEYVAVGTADLHAWQAEQKRRIDQAEAREIMKRARARYVEEADYARLAPLMTAEERTFVAQAFGLSQTLDTPTQPAAD